MKERFDDILGVFIKGVAAGIAICLGSVAYLAVENKVVGAILFSAGLFLVLTQKYALFTGLVPYLTETKGRGVRDACVAIVGNAVGALCAGTAIGFTRLGITEKAAALINVKANDSLLSIFILAVFCNAIIFYAVDLYKNHEHTIARYLGTLLLIPVFILCSYEHCVANMCYMAIARAYTPGAFAMLGMSILGNTIGGLAFYLMTAAVRKANKNNIP